MSRVNKVSYEGTSLTGLAHDFNDADVEYGHPNCYVCNLKTLEGENNSLYVELASDKPLLNKRVPKLVNDNQIETYLDEDENYTGNSAAISKYYFKLKFNKPPRTSEWKVVIENKNDDRKEHVYTLRKA